MNKKPWFQIKLRGWGWRPCSWEGWLITSIFVAFEIWNAMRLDAISHSASDTLRPFLIQTIFAAIVLGIIIFWKSEKIEKNL